MEWIPFVELNIYFPFVLKKITHLNIHHWWQTKCYCIFINSIMRNNLLCTSNLSALNNILWLHVSFIQRYVQGSRFTFQICWNLWTKYKWDTLNFPKTGKPIERHGLWFECKMKIPHLSIYILNIKRQLHIQFWKTFNILVHLNFI